MSRPVARATAASVGAMERAASSAASKPSVRAAISFSSMRRRSTSATSRPDQRTPSVPGLMESCRSAPSLVAVRRGIDVDDAHAALGAGGLDALVEDRVAPRGVGAGQHHEIGQLQVLVALRHHVGAEGAAVAGHRRGHAQARVGIDVRRADEALGQLVGDVIVLGQQLAREIEGDRLRPVLGPDGGEAGRHMIERLVPARTPAVDDRVQQPRLQPQRLAQRRALGAQPPEVRRMLRIARDGRPALAVRRRQHPAADAAVGACGADGTGPLSPLAGRGLG